MEWNLENKTWLNVDEFITKEKQKINTVERGIDI